MGHSVWYETEVGQPGEGNTTATLCEEWGSAGWSGSCVGWANGWCFAVSGCEPYLRWAKNGFTCVGVGGCDPSERWVNACLSVEAAARLLRNDHFMEWYQLICPSLLTGRRNE